MESKKLQNAQTLIRTSYAFNNFLNFEFYVPEQLGSTYQLDRNGTKEEYNSLIITHAILLLSVFKERLLKKDEDNSLSLKISAPAFDSLMGNLIKEDGSSYKIGDLPFQEKIDVLETLRNKLLHGDYYVDNDTIILNNKGITGSITLDELTRMCVLLLPSENFKLKGPNTRPMVDTTQQNIEKENKMKNLKDLKTYMSEVYYLRFIDLPEEGYERTIEYAHTLSDFYTLITNIKRTYPSIPIEEIFKREYARYTTILDNLHIQISYEKIPVPKTEYYNRIETLFLKNQKTFFNQLTPIERRATMQKIAMGILTEKDDDELIIANAIYNNMSTLIAYTHNINVYAVPLMQAHSFTYLDEMTVAGLMNAFYCIYHYGLDEIYSKQGSTSLKEIASGEWLNFARLKLDWFDDDDMTIDVSFADFPNQLEALRKAPIDLAARTEIAKRNLEGYRRSAAKKTEAKEQQLMDAVTACEQAEKEAKELYEKAKRFMEKDYHKHIKNFNIIAHIRNAFAHGNVRIKPYVKGDTLKEQKIEIQDIYEGALTYYLTIRYDDFYQLVMSPNIDIMRDFIDTKIEKLKEKEKTTPTKSKK